MQWSYPDAAQAAARGAVVRHLWTFVHLPSNAMTGIFSRHVEPTWLYVTLDGGGDIPSTVTNPHLLDALIQSSLGGFDQALGK